MLEIWTSCLLRTRPNSAKQSRLHHGSFYCSLTLGTEFLLEWKTQWLPHTFNETRWLEMPLCLVHPRAGRGVGLKLGEHIGVLLRKVRGGLWPIPVWGPSTQETEDQEREAPFPIFPSKQKDSPTHHRVTQTSNSTRGPLPWDPCPTSPCGAGLSPPAEAPYLLLRGSFCLACSPSAGLGDTGRLF